MHKIYPGYVEKIGEKVIGFTIIGVVQTPDGESWGLQLQKDTQTFIAWVDMDAEGNGPGHLNVEDGPGDDHAG